MYVEGACKLNTIRILKYTSVAISAVVAFHTRTVVGVNFVVTRSSILTRTTVTFVDVCKQRLRYNYFVYTCVNKTYIVLLSF